MELTEILKDIPNLVIAALALWWASKIIEKMIDNESKRMDSFLKIVENVSNMRNKIEMREHGTDKPQIEPDVSSNL